MNLFEHAERYPESAGSKERGGASEDAARLINKKRDDLLNVIERILRAHPNGMTVGDFLDKGFERQGHNAVAPRLSDLTRLGRAEKIGRRKHPSSPVALTVYRATQ